MKTLFESTGKSYKEKLGTMTVYVDDGTGDKVVGGSSVNWADFVEIKKHKKTYPMNNQLMSGLNQSSYI